MATRTSSKVAAGVQPKGLSVGLVAVTASYSVGAGTSLSAGDVIQMIKVPKNATPIYVAISGGSGDALISVGDGMSTARYISSGTMGSHTTVLRTINTKYVPYTYSLDDTIDILVGTVSVGTITGGFDMMAIFSMDT